MSKGPLICLVSMFCEVKVLVAQSSLTLWGPMDCSLPGVSVHGILQVRKLEWVAITFSRGSSPPTDQTLLILQEDSLHLSHQGSLSMAFKTSRISKKKGLGSNLFGRGWPMAWE